MKLTILGSGTMPIRRDRFPSSFLLETKKTKLLLDCGFGALARLAERNIDPRHLDGIFISHFHADHFGDAGNLICARYVGDRYEGKEHQSFIFIGPETLQDRLLKWREIVWPEPKEKYPIVFFEGTVKTEIGDIKIQTFPVTHVPWFPSIGIVCEMDGKKLVYPGDISSKHDFGELERIAMDADLLMIEAGYPTPQPTHLHLSQAAEVVQKARIKKALIVHTKPFASEQKRLQEFAKNNPRFSVAFDGMEVKI